MATRVWRLFIDESGNFDDVDDTVAVVGMLCPAALPQSSWLGLRRLLETAWPGMQWPLHAWLTYRPSMVALVALRTQQGESTSAESRDALAAARVLEEFAPSEMGAAMRALDEGDEPSRDILGEIERCLRRHAPALATALADTARRRRERIGLIAETTAAAASWPDGHAPAALLIASSEEIDGILAKATDRYLELLAALLARTVGVLGRGGPHDVWLHVATRHVMDETLRVRRPLHLEHLKKAAGRANSEGHGVRFIVGEVSAFGDHVHPGIVLADFASNRARMALGQATLPAAEAKLRALGWAIRSGAEDRTHLISWGLEGATTERTTDPLLKPWAREQAAEWEGAGRRA